MQLDMEEYFNHQQEVEYYCFNQQFHTRPKQARRRLAPCIP